MRANGPLANQGHGSVIWSSPPDSFTAVFKQFRKMPNVSVNHFPDRHRSAPKRARGNSLLLCSKLCEECSIWNKALHGRIKAAKLIHLAFLIARKAGGDVMLLASVIVPAIRNSFRAGLENRYSLRNVDHLRLRPAIRCKAAAAAATAPCFAPSGSSAHGGLWHGFRPSDTVAMQMPCKPSTATRGCCSLHTVS